MKLLLKRFHLNDHTLIALDPQSPKLKQVRTVKMKRFFFPMVKLQDFDHRLKS